MPSPVAGTIDYLYALDEDVYVIDTCSSRLLVRPGTVVRIRAEVLPTEDVVLYDITLEDNVVSVFAESNVFETKSDAVTAMSNRIE